MGMGRQICATMTSVNTFLQKSAEQYEIIQTRRFPSSKAGISLTSTTIFHSDMFSKIVRPGNAAGYNKKCSLQKIIKIFAFLLRTSHKKSDLQSDTEAASAWLEESRVSVSKGSEGSMLGGCVVPEVAGPIKLSKNPIYLNRWSARKRWEVMQA